MKEKVCSVGGCSRKVPAHQSVCLKCFKRRLRELEEDFERIDSIREEEVVE